MPIQTIGVVGAGSMGSGIANLAAMKGFQVILRDIEARFLDGALAKMDAFMSKSVAKGKMTETEKQETLARIRTTTNLDDMRDANVVIEAVLEDLELKKQVFSQLDGIMPENIIGEWGVPGPLRPADRLAAAEQSNLCNLSPQHAKKRGGSASLFAGTIQSCGYCGFC